MVIEERCFKEICCYAEKTCSKIRFVFLCGNSWQCWAIPYFRKILYLSSTSMKKIILAVALLASFVSVSANEIAPSVDKQTCEKPIYPKSALMNEESGTVILSVLVGPDGSVVDSKVEKSSGSKALDKATQKIYTSCKFKPGAKDGKPQQAWTKLEYVWNLS
ncbi:energy transducer TonB [Undibacterium sp. Ji50W]|uniref:energy transducer TonB n=1 Tax=Undibacterium sp. Ji50W TaxID=3413041 RepID=UPI003BF16FC2